MRGLYVLNTDAYDKIYGPAERTDIAALVDIVAPHQTAEAVCRDPSILADVDVIFSGWGMAPLTTELLAAAPNLQAVFYGAGSIRYFTTDAFWARGITVVSAHAANAEPVVEFTLAQILFSLKLGWHYLREVKERGAYPPKIAGPGGYGSVIGLIGLGAIGRRVAQLLQQFAVEVIAYDPVIDPVRAAGWGVALCSLEELFARADVVSLHAPWLEQTEGMITGAHLASMKPHATFINTARGALVREAEMIEVLRARPDLYAVLDVVYPEPPAPGSPLFTLPNVVLTPHIAGSMGRECRRMGRLMVDELRRYLAGEPLLWAVSRAQAELMA